MWWRRGATFRRCRGLCRFDSSSRRLTHSSFVHSPTHYNHACIHAFSLTETRLPDPKLQDIGVARDCLESLIDCAEALCVSAARDMVAAGEATLEVQGEIAHVRTPTSMRETRVSSADVSTM